MHTRISGVADHFAKNDDEALEKIRGIIDHLPKSDIVSPAEIKEPAYDQQEILGILTKDHRTTFKVLEIIARIADGSNFEEFKATYGKSLVTGFCKIGGFPVGIVANLSLIHI